MFVLCFFHFNAGFVFSILFVVEFGSVFFAYSPSLIGNLWTVGDRDIDRWFEHCFSVWMHSTLPPVPSSSGSVSPSSASLSSSSAPLSSYECVVHARKNAGLTLKYLTGAAPIHYGMPMFVKRD